MTEQGRLEEGVRRFQEALRLWPQYAEAHNNLGNALAVQGKRGEAEAACRQAIALKPDNALAHNNLGNALAAQGKLVEAVLRQFSQIAPPLSQGPGAVGSARPSQQLAGAVPPSLGAKRDSAQRHAVRFPATMTSPHRLAVAVTAPSPDARQAGTA